MQLHSALFPYIRLKLNFKFQSENYIAKAGQCVTNNR